MNVSTIRNPPRLAIHAVAAGALLLGALAYAWWAFSGTATERAKFEAVDITGVDWGKDFELTDFNQKQRTLADFRGKVALRIRRTKRRCAQSGRRRDDCARPELRGHGRSHARPAHAVRAPHEHPRGRERRRHLETAMISRINVSAK